MMIIASTARRCAVVVPTPVNWPGTWMHSHPQQSSPLPAFATHANALRADPKDKEVAAPKDEACLICARYRVQPCNLWHPHDLLPIAAITYPPSINISAHITINPDQCTITLQIRPMAGVNLLPAAPSSY